MTFATLPFSTGLASISMTATTASDPSGVEYFFTNLTIAGHNSDWQDSLIYTDTVLQPATIYSYTVMAHDKSARGNVVWV